MYDCALERAPAKSCRAGRAYRSVVLSDLCPTIETASRWGSDLSIAASIRAMSNNPPSSRSAARAGSEPPSGP